MRIDIKHALVASILVWSGVATPVLAQSGEKAASTPAISNNLFAVVYHQGPNWKAELPKEKQAMLEHSKYYSSAAKEGRVFAGGWLVDIKGGLAILRMSSFDEAKAFLAADPAVQNGTFVGEVHVWTPGVFAEGAKEALRRVPQPAQRHQPGS